MIFDFYIYWNAMKTSKRLSVKKWIMQFDLNAKKLGQLPNTEMNKEYRAVIYCRVSEMKQATQWFWLEWQERLCKDRCSNQSPPVEVDMIYIEPWISGAKTNRKQFNKCLAYLEEQNKKYQKITHFIVSEASRISRPDDISEAFMMEASIKATWVKIVSLDMPWIDENTDEGHLFKTISYAIAGYERKKIRKRAHNGKIGRMKNGFRPFNDAPVGYLRLREWAKNYQDSIDSEKWPIIKQGLEMFANDILLTQADLWRFRVAKGLRTNAKNAKTLPRTFPEKVLQLHRLFYYTWHIYYPKWGITAPIIAQHQGLISLSTAYLIIEKIQKLHKGSKRSPLKTNKMTKEDPLRGVVICPYCNRRFTSWNTSKYRMKEGVRLKKLYPYYWCANPNCDKKVYIRKQVLEWAFEKLLEWMTLSKEMIKVIELIFLSTRNKNVKGVSLTITNKKKTLWSIQKRQDQVEWLLLRTTNPKLWEKLETERWALEAEKENVRDQINKQTNTKDKMKGLLAKTIALVNNPKSLRQKWSSTMRQLLIKVRFWDHLYYTKEDGLRTTENAVLYSLMVDFNCSNNLVRQAGAKDRTFKPRFFEQLTTCIQDNTEYINAITNRREYDKSSSCEENEKSSLSLEPP